MTMAVQGQKHYVNYTPGIEEPEEYQYKDKVVAIWGISVPGRNGCTEEILMGWKVSGARRGIDNPKRLHGPQGKPDPMSKSSKEYLEAMFRGW